MFLRKKSSPKIEAKPQEKNAQDYKYAEALDWTAERLALKEKQARLGWNVAKILTLVLVLVSIVAIVIAFKKESYPFIVELDKSTGTTRVIDIRDPQNIPVDEMMDKYWLNLYTLSRESYDYRTLENDHARVRLMSVPEVFSPYDNQYGVDNKKSIQNLLKDKKKIVCEIESVVPNGNGIATVRFTKRLLDTYTNQEEAKNSWRATIGYEYNPTFEMSESQRLINPLGFTVTSWRVDPIMGGAQ
ncbi:type IV secretion system protein [uncultured Parasutterella sp.]|jgi:Type IV secretory pathway, component VirB8|uniref:virB8 family protein n=2 Tax=uncultured Parasutterella sp. TaxID=1263098 RepID=UPI0025B64F1A|nr:type IV secretion system protein [uncultured Parasutterella sp.]